MNPRKRSQLPKKLPLRLKTTLKSNTNNTRRKTYKELLDASQDEFERSVDELLEILKNSKNTQD